MSDRRRQPEAHAVSGADESGTRSEVSSTEQDRNAARRATLNRVTARRERHRKRPIIVRVLAVVAGFLLSLAGLAFVLWLPELGLPLLLTGLGLLALEFEWAARAQARVEWYAQVFRRWFRGLSAPVKLLLVLGTLAGVVAVAWLVFF